ncbi:uncharacterized protein LOC132564003, partial [Ylistrum balloti]|uniref:uncharacterized protein LOC132564003 n=1 Tax=Ylistrum balloti TaxID=509963 RepID=UPI002905E791
MFGLKSLEFVSVLIHDVAASKFLLTNIPEKGLWLPTGTKGEGETLQNVALRIANEVTGQDVGVKGLLKTTFIHFVKSPSVVLVTFLMHPVERLDLCAQEAVWLSEEQIEDKLKSSELLGTELVNFIQQIQNGPALINTLNETNVEYVDTESVTDLSQLSAQEALIKSAKFGKKEQDLFFQEFMSWCLPSQTMNFEVFRAFITHKGARADLVEDFFRAFDTHKRRILNFKEVLLGLAAMEPSTQHGGMPAEMRCRYIFRFYDKNMDSFLQFSEFREMVRDIRQIKGLSTDDEAVSEDAMKSAKCFGTETKNKLPIGEFLTAVGQLKFRGTSVLFRLSHSSLTSLKNSSDGATSVSSPGKEDETEPPSKRYRPKLMDAMKVSPPRKLNMTDPDADVFKLPEGRPVMSGKHHGPQPKYELATHTVKVRRTGFLSDVIKLWDLQGTTAVAESAVSHLEGDISRFQRMSSIDSFNQIHVKVPGYASNDIHVRVPGYSSNQIYGRVPGYSYIQIHEYLVTPTSRSMLEYLVTPPTSSMLEYLVTPPTSYMLEYLITALSGSMLGYLDTPPTTYMLEYLVTPPTSSIFQYLLTPPSRSMLKYLLTPLFRSMLEYLDTPPSRYIVPGYSSIQIHVRKPGYSYIQIHVRVPGYFSIRIHVRVPGYSSNLIH